jgi:hypothetical protein
MFLKPYWGYERRWRASLPPVINFTHVICIGSPYKVNKFREKLGAGI